MSEEAPRTRSGFVALIEAPNAGKSTLVNRLVGAKVSIVTHKVQTTRSIVRGIATHGDAQIVFVDTPGIFEPRRRLDTAMVGTAWGVLKLTLRDSAYDWEFIPASGASFRDSGTGVCH